MIAPSFRPVQAEWLSKARTANYAAQRDDKVVSGSTQTALLTAEKTSQKDEKVESESCAHEREKFLLKIYFAATWKAHSTSASFYLISIACAKLCFSCKMKSLRLSLKSKKWNFHSCDECSLCWCDQCDGAGRRTNKLRDNTDWWKFQEAFRFQAALILSFDWLKQLRDEVVGFKQRECSVFEKFWLKWLKHDHWDTNPAKFT